MIRDNVAVVLGGTEDHIQLIKKLQIRGYFVLLIDYNEDPPAKQFANKYIKESILEKNIVLHIAKTEKAKLVIAACIDQAIPVMAYVSEKLSLPCHLSYKKALQVTNKKKMKLILRNHNIPTSPFQILKSENPNRVDRLEYPLVIKPLDANSSKGITKVTSSVQLTTALKYASSFGKSNEIIIEEYIEGNEYSADILIKNGEAHVLMITENVKSQVNLDHFTITKSLYNQTFQKKYEKIIKKSAQKIASAFSLDNVTLLVQLIIKDDISIIEFSPRIGGGSKHHFIKEITGFDILDFYISTVIKSGLPNIKRNSRFKYGCIQYLYGLTGIFMELKGGDVLKQREVIFDYFYYKTPGMPIMNHITSSDRPAGYMILDNDYNSFQNKQKISNQELQVIDNNGNNITSRI